MRKHAVVFVDVERPESTDGGDAGEQLNDILPINSVLRTRRSTTDSIRFVATLPVIRWYHVGHEPHYVVLRATTPPAAPGLMTRPEAAYAEVVGAVRLPIPVPGNYSAWPSLVSPRGTMPTRTGCGSPDRDANHDSSTPRHSCPSSDFPWTCKRSYATPWCRMQAVAKRLRAEGGDEQDHR